MIGVIVAIVVCVGVGALCLRFVRRMPWDHPTERVLSAFIDRHAREDGFAPDHVWVSNANQSGAAIESAAGRILLIAKTVAREGRPEGYQAFFGAVGDIRVVDRVGGRSIEIETGRIGGRPSGGPDRDGGGGFVLLFSGEADWERWTALLAARPDRRPD